MLNSEKNCHLYTFGIPERTIETWKYEKVFSALLLNESIDIGGNW